MKSLILSFSLLLQFSLLAQEPKENEVDEATKKINEQVEAIKTTPPNEYVTKTQLIRRDIDKFIDFKKGVCAGDYSTFVLDHKDLASSEHKLTKIEKDLCYRELRAIQVKFINNLFIAKKNYLNFLHEERLKKLEEIRNDTLRTLKATYDKQLISPKGKK